MGTPDDDLKRFSLPDWVRVHNDRRTEIFTCVCFLAAPVAGSVASIVVNVGSVGGVLEIGRRVIGFSRDRFMLYLAVPIYLYCFSYLFSLVANPAPQWRHVLPILPLLLFPFLYSSWCLSNKTTVARSAVAGSMIACYGALALAIVQFHFLGIRAEGGAGNAIVFAMMTCMAASIALAGAFTKEGMAAVPLFAAYCAGSIAILYSGSRMTWVALFIATGVILWIYRRRRHAFSSALAVSCAGLAVAAVTFAGTQVIPSRVSALVQDWQQLGSGEIPHTSLGRRTELWTIGLDAVQARPFAGTGAQSTKPLIRAGFDRIGSYASHSHFHNGFLNAWVEAGLLGMLSLAAIFVVAGTLAIRTLFARPPPSSEARLGAVILIAVVVTYVVNGLTGILVGHDILDAMLMALLVVGSYLAGGTSLLKDTSSRS